jgi:hypothetical protein
MAKRIEGPYDFSEHSFNSYADGATWELTQGEDFDVKPSVLALRARRWARNEGIGAETKVIDGEPPVVAVRFTRVGQLRALEHRTA